MRHGLAKLFLITAVFLIGNAYAGPPFISDDPDNLDEKQTQIFLFSIYSRMAQKTTIYIPAFELDYGITNDLELNAITSYAFTYPHVTGKPNASGMSDSQLELKYRFIHETKQMPEVAFAPVYYIPTGNVNRNLGNGRPSLLLPLWLQKSFDSWTMYGGGGYIINPAPKLKNYLLAGVVLQKALNDKLTLGGEIYSTGQQSITVKASTLFDFGGNYQVSKLFGIQFAAGHNIIGQQQIYAYAGVNWTIG